MRVLTQLASVVVLSRLLAPTDFGIMAMVAPVVAFTLMIQDFGLSQATVQRKTITHDDLTFLFWTNVALGGGVAVALVAIAPLVARLYDEPAAGALTAAMSLSIVVASLGAQHTALLNRRMAFGRLATLEVITALTGLCVSIAAALVLRSWWALYAGLLAGALAGLVASWAMTGWRPGRPNLRTGDRSMLRFGAGIAGFNLANFFARNLDDVLIGAAWGSAALGFYDRAYKLLLFPLTRVMNPLSKVMVPTLSRLQEDDARYRSAYLRTISLLLLALLPGIAAGAAIPDVVVPFLLGEEWRASAGIFGALAVAGLIQPLNNSTGWLFISQGRSGDYARWGLFGAVTAVLAFVIGLPFGAYGVAVAYAASEYLRTPLLWLWVGRAGPVRAVDLAGIGAVNLAGAAAATAAAFGAAALAPEPALVRIAAALVAAYAASALVLACFAPGRAAQRSALALAREHGRALVQRLSPRAGRPGHADLD